MAGGRGFPPQKARASCLLFPHLRFGHQRELRAVAVPRKRLDVSVAARLLLPELVAGECQDLEAPVAVPAVQLLEAAIVDVLREEREGERGSR